MALRNDEKIAIEKLLADGMTQAKIAEIVGCHETTVHRYVDTVRERDGAAVKSDRHPHMYFQGVREAAMDMYVAAKKLLNNPRIPYDLQVEIRKALDDERTRLCVEAKPHD